MNHNRDDDAKIDLTEFSELVKTKTEMEDDDVAKKFFDTFDHDQTGFLTKEEFREIWELLGKNITEEELEVKFIKADENEDGKINYEGT